MFKFAVLLYQFKNYAYDFNRKSFDCLLKANSEHYLNETTDIN